MLTQNLLLGKCHINGLNSPHLQHVVKYSHLGFEMMCAPRLEQELEKSFISALEMRWRRSHICCLGMFAFTSTGFRNADRHANQLLKRTKILSRVGIDRQPYLLVTWKDCIKSTQNIAHEEDPTRLQTRDRQLSWWCTNLKNVETGNRITHTTPSPSKAALSSRGVTGIST